MKKIFKRIKRWHIIVFTSIIVACLSCLSIWCFYKYKEKHQLVEINLYDEVQKIYNGLIKAGYTVIGTEEEFRKNIADIDNRKELYDMVSANGDVKLGSFDYFSKRIDYALYSSIKEDTSQSLQSKNIRERHRQLYNDLSKYYKVNGSFEEFKQWFIVYENRKICYQWLKQKQTITPIAFDKKYAISSCPAWYYIANEIMQDNVLEFETNNKTYRVKEGDLDAFAKDFPDAITLQNVNGQDYEVFARDYKSFQEEFFPKTSPTSEVKKNGIRQLYEDLDVKYDFNEFKEELSTLSGKEKAYKSLPWYYKENLDWFGFITKYELVPRVADINTK